MNPEHRQPYLEAASAVRRRLSLARFVGLVRRSHLVVGILALATVLFLRLVADWRAGEWIPVAAGLLVWLSGAAAIALGRRPGTQAALLTLDRRGGWKDCFSSAWEFLQSPEPSEAERLHLGRAATLLPEARRQVDRILPVAPMRTVWVAPALALLFAFLPWGRTLPDASEFALTEEMRSAAALQAELLKREAVRVRELSALSEEEKKELEALRAEVEAAAEALSDPEGMKAGEMLESLENRASAAERLAEKLERFSDEWASPEMLAEMGRQPDTADLALFIGDKQAESAANEAMELQGLLGDDKLTGETSDRFTRGLEGIMGAATEKDHERPVGERFGNAFRKMLDAQPATAAREFEELAKHFRELAAREEAKKKLEELAANLREAGSEIGGSELKKMEEIARQSSPGATAPAGLKSLDAGTPNPMGPAPGPGQSPEPAPGQATGTPSLATLPPGTVPQAPVPGAVPGQGEEGGVPKAGEQAFAAPIPGEKSPDGKTGTGLGMSDKAAMGKDKGGMLMAPIPGTDPSAPTPGAAMSLGSGASAQSGQGGDQAGVGTAEMGKSESDRFKATGDAEVLAQAGRDGDSSLRAIEGQTKTEEATRTRQEILADFLAVEEQALDDQSLPLSRRQQVLRYFSGVREQFEKTDPD